MDTIFLHDLRADTLVGINEWEQRIRQSVRIDLELAADVRTAAARDAIDDTVDYKSLAKRVLAFVESSRFQLIETLAERIAELIISEFPVPWVKITLGKPGAVRGAREVGVVIERGERN